MKRLTVILIVIVSFMGCIHPQIKFRKGALLDPLMTPKQGISNSIMASEPSIGVEKGGLSGSDGSLGSNCPTCG
jgi:hypothetical protein